jgi:hypothetical protein
MLSPTARTADPSKPAARIAAVEVLLHGGRGGGWGPRLCLGIRFRRTQPGIYIAGECPGLYPGVHLRREGSSLDDGPKISVGPLETLLVLRDKYLEMMK